MGLAATGVGRNVGIFCSILYYWLQLDNKGQTPQSPITTTDTLGLNTDIMASYIYINTSGFVRMSISFDINFLQPGDFDCGDGFLSSAPLFALIDYHTGNDVQTYEVKNGNFQPSGRSILYADTSNDQDIKWRGSFILEVTAGQFYWFKTTSVTKNYFGIANAVASSINGSFEIDYLQLL